jgi:hypothetical protein
MGLTRWRSTHQERTMKSRNEEAVAIGIDISKAYFDVAYEADGIVQHQRFNNDKEGFHILKAWLQKRKVGQAHFAMEATGRYGLRYVSSSLRQNC